MISTNNFIFGRYIPGNAWIYKMNPIMKIILTFYFTLIVFLANNWISYAILWLLAIISIYFSGINIKTFFNGIKAILFIILITVIIQILFSVNGNVIFNYGPIKITNLGIKYGIFIFFRFTLIVIASTILTLSTKPLAIAYGIEKIMSPLNKLHFPVEVLSLMISIALRFVPTLIDEISSIIKAQKARGANFNNGNLIKRANAIASIFIPLFLVAMNHASDLGDAMVSRGYKSNVKRSQYHHYHINHIDWISCFTYLLFGVLIVFIRK
ncbi:energy-coupling factor transporter transmembrane protein EcfT [Philodulcilactobacillus myokoensis]|uniref:Energy-coupling factor transporter transmembrane protein EcfT n=1 Tax=Philodulcilactobacillus myokoensis TaxID=2929573 RepID=A0A9W6B1Y2_9LACO|nr:energy-coupling factor transporter transmembrane component T [Philodulcilactobacillus myokoensis]GLB46634.1 energy-coupling factor transporter transmembrane protein EcfT [Philodulcilactobacillus myokoensis]